MLPLATYSYPKYCDLMSPGQIKINWKSFGSTWHDNKDEDENCLVILQMCGKTFKENSKYFISFHISKCIVMCVCVCVVFMLFIKCIPNLIIQHKNMSATMLTATKEFYYPTSSNHPFKVCTTNNVLFPLTKPHTAT